MNETTNPSTTPTSLSDATMDTSAFAAMNAAHFDPVPESSLDQMEKTGRAYTNEVRNMARELKRLRAELAELKAPKPFWATATWPTP